MQRGGLQEMTHREDWWNWWHVLLEKVVCEFYHGDFIYWFKAVQVICYTNFVKAVSTWLNQLDSCGGISLANCFLMNPHPLLSWVVMASSQTNLSFEPFLFLVHQIGLNSLKQFTAQVSTDLQITQSKLVWQSLHPEMSQYPGVYDPNMLVFAN